MRKIPGLTIILLTAMTVLGWYTTLFAGVSSRSREYEEMLSTAEDYAVRELYELAIGQYQRVIALKKEAGLYDKCIDLYKAWMREDNDRKAAEGYLLVLEEAVAAFPKEERYYSTLADAYVQQQKDYKKAYQCLETARVCGINSDTLDRQWVTVVYSYELGWRSYEDIMPLSNGIYGVKNETGWGYIDQLGNEVLGCTCQCVSLVGEDGIRLLSDGQVRLLDEDDVVQGKMTQDVAWAGSYAEGLIPIRVGAQVGYYNLLGDYQFGVYQRASRFQDGKAAVQEMNGTWKLVDQKGAVVSQQSYEDIVLSGDGSYEQGEIMIAACNGSYAYYNKNGEQVGSFVCDEMDSLTKDGMIAYREGELWGYVDTDGTILIQPQFIQARSFSNGLAAVFDGNKWGFIDSDGRLVIDYQFYDVDDFNADGACFVKTDTERWRLITRNILP